MDLMCEDVKQQLVKLSSPDIHELPSRDREDGRACRHRKPARSGEAGGPSGNRPAVTRGWFRGVPERYVAGAYNPRTPGFLLVEHTARREGRPYPWSQSRQGVNS
jgi:hypothetical protein